MSRSKKNNFSYILNAIIGFSGLLLFVIHILRFPDLDLSSVKAGDVCIGSFMPTPFLNFAYFTYQTLIIFSIWLLIGSFGYFFSNKKAMSIYKSQLVSSFIFTNYLITNLLYTAFELSSGHPTFGYYGKSFSSIINFLGNITVHYLLFYYCTYLFFTKRSLIKKTDRKNFLLPILYMSFYFISIKLIGKFAFSFEWYPYPIFNGQAFMAMFGIHIKNTILSDILIMCGEYIFMIVVYFDLLNLMFRIKHKVNMRIYKKERKNSLFIPTFNHFN